jgi:ribulose-phosphate 3-epimerase
MKIIPAILTENFDEFEKQIETASSYTEEVYVDVIDWERTENKTITVVKALSVKDHINMHFDLMLDDPREAVAELLKDKRVKSIILNYFDQSDLSGLIGLIKENDVEVGLSLNPEIFIKDIKKLLPELDYVQIFTINPGKQGQQFIPGMMEKAKDLRKIGFRGKIVLDGGVNENTIPNIKNYPIDILSVGSAISKAHNPKDYFEKLKRLAEK